MQGCQRRVCLIGIHVADGSEIDSAFRDRFTDFPDRFDFRC
jgi:hypothetical protein